MTDGLVATLPEYCIHCNHGWSEHHTLARVSHDADGKPLPPFGTVIPCDLCGCARYYGRIPEMMRWRVYWSNATGCGNDTIDCPDNVGRSVVRERYERANVSRNVDKLEQMHVVKRGER